MSEYIIYLLLPLSNRDENSLQTKQFSLNFSSAGKGQFMDSKKGVGGRG